MKLTKMDCMLNERDSLQDMLEAEKQLMSLYATALFEGSTKSVRNCLSENLIAVAEDQYCIFNQMKSRGYYEPQPANKSMIDTATDTYKKQKNSLKAN